MTTHAEIVMERPHSLIPKSQHRAGGVRTCSEVRAVPEILCRHGLFLDGVFLVPKFSQKVKEYFSILTSGSQAPSTSTDST